MIVADVADRYAEALREAGFAILLYDHRNFGISDGEPRGELNRMDFRREAIAMPSITFVPRPRSTNREWLSGAIALARVKCLSLGACYYRVKAIVSQTTACGPTMPPQDPDRAVFAALRRTSENGDVGTPESVTGPLPVVHSISAAPLLYLLQSPPTDGS